MGRGHRPGLLAVAVTCTRGAGKPSEALTIWGSSGGRASRRAAVSLREGEPPGEPMKEARPEPRPLGTAPLVRSSEESFAPSLFHQESAPVHDHARFDMMTGSHNPACINSARRLSGSSARTDPGGRRRLRSTAGLAPALTARLGLVLTGGGRGQLR